MKSRAVCWAPRASLVASPGGTRQRAVRAKSSLAGLTTPVKLTSLPEVAAAAPRASRAGLPLRGSGPNNVWQCQASISNKSDKNGGTVGGLRHLIRATKCGARHEVLLEPEVHLTRCLRTLRTCRLSTYRHRFARAAPAPRAKRKIQKIVDVRRPSSCAPLVAARGAREGLWSE